VSQHNLNNLSQIYIKKLQLNNIINPNKNPKIFYYRRELNEAFVNLYFHHLGFFDNRINIFQPFG